MDESVTAENIAAQVVTAKIIWIASFPKSGNTWMRALLTNYIRDAATPADINELQGGPIASSRLWFDEWSGIEASALSEDVVEQLRPEVYRCLVREASETLYMKVHDAWGYSRRGEELFPSDITAGVVYLLRNPLDVAASWAHHRGIGMGEAVENLCASDFTIGPSNGMPADQLPQKLYDWSGHVRSWIKDSAPPVHVVRYEDLRRDPEGVFGQVVRFCGLPWDATRIRKAISFSEFCELKRQEEANGFRERPICSTSRFFRKGKSDSWREDLTEDLAKRIVLIHGQTMKAYGYLQENGMPV